MTNDFGEHWTLLTDGVERHSGRSADARRARGSGAGGPALRGNARGRVRLVRSGQALAVAADESAGHAGHRSEGASRRSAGVDDGPLVLDHGRRGAAAADCGGAEESRPASSGRTIPMGARAQVRASGGSRRCARLHRRKTSPALVADCGTERPAEAGALQPHPDQAVRRLERVPLHAGGDVSHTLRARRLAGRTARVSAGRRAHRLLPRRAPRGR